MIHIKQVQPSMSPETSREKSALCGSEIFSKRGKIAWKGVLANVLTLSIWKERTKNSSATNKTQQMKSLTV